LLEELYAFHGIDRRRIGLEIDADDIALDIEQALPLGLILSELITNCFKHAFPGNRTGTIRVLLKYRKEANTTDLEDGGCCLSVSDDGVGVASDRDESGSNSIGLHIIRLLAQELAGTLRVTPNEQQGANFAIEFPLARRTPAPETGEPVGHESSMSY
jgi:two-component sensor histidine kinase